MFDSIRSCTKALGELDAASFGVAEVEAHLDELKALRSALTVASGRLLTRSKALAEAGKGAGPIETQTRRGDTSPKSATKEVERSETLDDAPELADSMLDGTVTEDHLDALSAATRDLPDEIRRRLREDPEITAAAQRLTPEAFRFFVARRIRQIVDADGLDRQARLYAAMGIRIWAKPDGTLIVNGTLDPEHGAALQRAIDAETATLAQLESRPFNDHTRALALSALVRRGLSADGGPTPADVTIIDAATLAGGTPDHTIAETGSGISLAPDTIRRHLCHARVTAITLGPNGVTLDAGTENRTATRAQRRALRAMYRTCAFDCDVPFDRCQIHHIRPWEHGGPTDLANLLPVCSRHHHLLHEGRWQIHLAPDRTLTIWRPDHTHHATVPLEKDALVGHLADHRSGAPPGRDETDTSSTGPPPVAAFDARPQARRPMGSSSGSTRPAEADDVDRAPAAPAPSLFAMDGVR